MPKPFDPTKPVQLEDGTPARIICTDRKGDYPIVALIGGGDNEIAISLSEKGCAGPYRLVNIPQKHVRWVNIYPSAQETREGADMCAADTRIACIRIEFEVGEGL